MAEAEVVLVLLGVTLPLWDVVTDALAVGVRVKESEAVAVTVADDVARWDGVLVAEALWLAVVLQEVEEVLLGVPGGLPVVVAKWIAYPGIDFVVIGTIYEPAPEPLPDPYTPVPLPGYGVNVRFNPWCDQVDLADDMVQFITVPADPQYTFAGGWFPGPKTPATQA